MIQRFAPTGWPRVVPRLSVDERQQTTAFLYVYVEVKDLALRKAVSLGAKVIEPPMEVPYGDRRAMFEDPWGNRWQIATHRRFDGGG
ncbi:MAG: VOC family protein [Pseudomonadales bacterium]